MRFHHSVLFVLLSATLSFGQAVLPLTTTTLSKSSLPTGFSHSGLGSDYSGPKLKFDGTGDELIVHVNSQPGDLRFDLGTNNSFTGTQSGATEFQVLESSNGTTYTTVFTEGNGSSFIKGSKTISTLNSTTRYIKFLLTNKVSGTNVALYNIEIDAGAPLSPCVAPSTPASITFVTVGATSVDATFAASVTASGYLVLRTSGSTAPTVVDATVYSSANAPSGSFFEYDGSATSFSSSGLSSSTVYYFHVYAYTSSGCIGGPVYSGARTASTTTLASLNNSKFNDFDLNTDLVVNSSTGVSISSSSTSNPSGNSFGTGGNGAVTNDGLDTIVTCAANISAVSQFEFNLASLSGTSGNGADGGDFVAVDVSTNGGSTFTTVMTVTGASNSQWLYSAVDSAVTSYSSPTSAAPSGGGNRTATDGIGKVKITGIPAGNIVVRLRLSNNAAAEYWAVDDLKLSTTSSATFAHSVEAVVNEYITNSGTTSTLTWENPDCYSNIVVIAKEASAPSFDPATNNCGGTAGDCIASDFTASAAFAGTGSNSNLPAMEYCVYNGSGESVTVTGLTPNVTYHYEIFTHLNPWSTKASSPNLSVISLPVDLVSFTGESTQNSIELKWETASEKNNSHFEVYRSLDAKSFEKIGQVVGQGNSQTLNGYDYTDKIVGAVQYYQLKQVDFDGEYEYSKVIAVKSEESTLNIVKQTSDFFEIAANDKTKVWVTNQNGQVLLNTMIEGVFKVEKSDYSKGMFVLLASNAKGIQVIKWINTK